MSFLECPKMDECKDYRIYKEDGKETLHCFNPTDHQITVCFKPKLMEKDYGQ